MQRSPLWRWLSPILSIAILVGIFFSLRKLNIDELRAVVPRSPLFWLVFLLFYFSAPAADFAIFRRLWKIPAEGFIALCRKMISNELVLGYVGEVYFYSWARRKIDLSASPFGAVKDVAILSAVMGNLTTLAMIAVTYPILSTLQLPVASKTILISIGVMIALSMLPIIFGNRLFSLPRRDLWFVATMHFLRISVGAILLGIAWALALPLVHFTWWIALATLRMLTSRLPFVPQKDVVFAGLATFLVGHDLEIAALLAFMAALILTTHIVLGAILAIGDFVDVRRS